MQTNFLDIWTLVENAMFHLIENFNSKQSKNYKSINNRWSNVHRIKELKIVTSIGYKIGFSYAIYCHRLFIIKLKSFCFDYKPKIHFTLKSFLILLNINNYIHQLNPTGQLPAPISLSLQFMTKENDVTIKYINIR